MTGHPTSKAGGEIDDEDIEGEAVDSTLQVARRQGYLLVGPSERVYRRDNTGRRCESVPVQEDGWVHELIQRGLLEHGDRLRLAGDGPEARAVALVVAGNARPKRAVNDR